MHCLTKVCVSYSTYSEWRPTDKTHIHTFSLCLSLYHSFTNTLKHTHSFTHTGTLGYDPRLALRMCINAEKQVKHSESAAK